MNLMQTNTPNPKLKPTCQLTLMVKGSDNKQILGYCNSFNNNILIYSTHVEFNNRQILHDRNGYAYAVYYDAIYAVIFVTNPSALQVLNMRNGDMMVGRGLDDIANYSVISVSVQRDEEIKTGQQSRRIYMIMEYKGANLIKMIQIQPKIDNDPKTRNKPIQQNLNNNALLKPFFSNNRWNVFIWCLKQSIEVCRPRNKNNEIEVQFSTQALERSLTELYRNHCVLAMSESSKTWTLLCANKTNTRQQPNIVLNIFWQHYSQNDLTKTMYCRDDAFIKTVVLPCLQKQFIKMWQYDEFYLIEAKGKQFGSHRCYVVAEYKMFEGFGTDFVVINLSQNSTVCPLSIEVNHSGISICQVINKIQLNRIKYSLKNETQSNQPNQSVSQPTQNNPQITTNTNSIGQPMNTQTTNSSQPTNNKLLFPTIPNTSANTPQGPSNQSSSNVNENKNQIKRFQPIPEPPVQQQTGQQGKLTVRKHDPPQNTQTEQSQNLLNPRLVEHLERAEIKSSASESLEVPTTVERLHSFGISGQTKDKPIDKPKEQIPSVVLHSFGPGTRAQASVPSVPTVPTVPKMPTSPSINSQKEQKSPSPVQLKQQKKQKQKPTLSASQIKETRQLFINITNKMREELKLRQQSFKDNYECLSINQLIKFDNIFTQKQQNRLKNYHRAHSQMQAYFSKLEEGQKRLFCENLNKFNKIRTKLQKVVMILQINALENVQEFKLIRKINRKPKTKQFTDLIQESLNQMQQRISDLQMKTQQLIEKYQKIQPKKNNPKPQTSTKQIFKLLSREQPKPKLQKALKTPLLRQIHNAKNQPLHKLIPL